MVSTERDQLLRHTLQMPEVISTQIKQRKECEVVTHVHQQARGDGASDHSGKSQNQAHDEQHQQWPPGLAQLFAMHHGKAAAGNQHSQSSAPASGGRSRDRLCRADRSQHDGEHNEGNGH